MSDIATSQVYSTGSDVRSTMVTESVIDVQNGCHFGTTPLEKSFFAFIHKHL